MSGGHDPYPSVDDDRPDLFVIKLHRPIGQLDGQTEIDLRVSPAEEDEVRAALRDKGLPESTAIELSTVDTLSLITTALVGGGATYLGAVLASLIRKNRDKEYRFYVDGQLVELKGMAASDVERVIDKLARRSLGAEPDVGERGDEAPEF